MASAAQLLKEYKKYNMTGFTDEIEKQYGERTNYNKDLIDQQNAITQEQLAAPAQLRNDYYNSPSRNALNQENVIAQSQANIGSRLGSVTDMLNARKQGFNDILSKGISGYQMNMENSWRVYQDAVQREQFAAQLRASGGGGGSSWNPFDQNGNGVNDELEGKGGGGPTAEVEGVTDKATSAVDKYAKYKKASQKLGGGFLGNLSGYYKTYGLGAFNPLTALTNTSIASTGYNPTISYLTAAGKSGASKFASVWNSVNKKKK